MSNALPDDESSARKSGERRLVVQAPIEISPGRVFSAAVPPPPPLPVLIECWSTITLTSTMALNQEASAFKAALARQDYTSWHSQPPPLKAEDAEYTESPKKKAKKAKSSLPFLPLLSLKDIAVLIIGNYRRCIFPTCRYWDRNKCEHAASISRV